MMRAFQIAQEQEVDLSAELTDSISPQSWIDHAHDLLRQNAARDFQIDSFPEGKRRAGAAHDASGELPWSRHLLSSRR